MGKSKLLLTGFIIAFFLAVPWVSAQAKEEPCRRIVSLSPAMTEAVYLLGEGDKLVGVTTYCLRPAEAQTKEKVGSVKEVSTEKIIDLRPDLVIATSLTSTKVVEKLCNTGINVVVFEEPKSYVKLCEQFNQLARLIGREDRARDVLRKADTRIDEVKKKVRDLDKPKVFVQMGAKPLFAAIGNSFINDFIVFAGARNIAAEASVGLYSREEVIRQNPDAIIILTMGIAGDQEKEMWGKYDSISAVKNDRVYILDSEKVCSLTPLSFSEALEEIASLIHPELKGAFVER